MDDESITARLKRFDREVKEAMSRDADDRITGFAAEYDIPPDYVEAALPRIYVSVGIEVELRRAGCTDEQISECTHYVFMLLNGVKQRAEDSN